MTVHYGRGGCSSPEGLGGGVMFSKSSPSFLPLYAFLLRLPDLRVRKPRPFFPIDQTITEKSPLVTPPLAPPKTSSGEGGGPEPVHRELR